MGECTQRLFHEIVNVRNLRVVGIPRETTSMTVSGVTVQCAAFRFHERLVTA
jgi:hypothetical protein